MDGQLLAILGLAVVLASAGAYLAMLFVLRRFTYRSWLFHSAVLGGISLAVVGWTRGGSVGVALAAVLAGAAWFVIANRELRLHGSPRLRVGRGDRFPPFVAVTVDGRTVTEHELVARAPAVLVLYRGWWCPSSRSQHEELIRHAGRMHAAGLTVFAASVDGPAQARPVQEAAGKDVTILCDVAPAQLDELGVCDRRGAPWYDRLLFGVTDREIAMPSVFVVDADGRVAYANRSTRVDEKPGLEEAIAELGA